MDRVLPIEDINTFYESIMIKTEKIRCKLFILAAVFFLTLCLRSPKCEANPGSLSEKVREKTLANGLTILVLPRHFSPTVSLQMSYLVGGVDETSGRTGTAHLLEHMLFKGTKELGTLDWAAEEPLLKEIEAVGKALDAERRKGGAAGQGEVARLKKRLEELQERHQKLVVKGEIDGIYSRNGAVGFNASTSSDMTNYTVNLPSNRLELWARMEAERMREPILREYYKERDVILEERRQRYETDPGGRLYSALLSAAYTAHPYRDPVIGWPSDIAYLDIAETREFYEKYYGPNNACIVAVGDVDPDEFFDLVERFFGGIPRREDLARRITAEPPRDGQRRVEVIFDAEPRLIVAYNKPTLPSRADYVFDVIDAVLTDGRSSRLVRRLVDEKKIVTSVDSANGIPGARYENLFALFLTPVAGVDLDEVESALEAELAAFSENPPTQEELDRVVRRLEASRVRALLSNTGLARSLAYYQMIAGSWRYMEEFPEILKTITPPEVAETARKYLVDSNRTTASLHSLGGN